MKIKIEKETEIRRQQQLLLLLTPDYGVDIISVSVVTKTFFFIPFLEGIEVSSTPPENIFKASTRSNFTECLVP